jgi:serine/threonine protein kinase
MSPERARTGRMGVADDYWSAGVLFYEMLAGKPPFVGDTAMQIAFAHVHAPPPSLPSTYDFIEPLVMKMLAKDPKQRFPDLKAFVAELKGALVGSPVLQKRLKIDPNADISEQLKAIGFSENQLSHRPRAMIGVEIPQGALKHALLEGSSLAAANLEEPAYRQEKKSEPVHGKPSAGTPMWIWWLVIVLFCAGAVGVVGLIF